MFRTAALVLLITSASGAFACDADVLRYNYRKAPAAKPAATPATALPKTADVLRKMAAPLTASTKLGPR